MDENNGAPGGARRNPILPIALGSALLLAVGAAAFVLWPRNGTVMLEVAPAVFEVIVATEGGGRQIFDSNGGRLELSLPEGRYVASVRAEGHEPAELLLVVTAGAPTRETVTLQLLTGRAHFELKPR